MKKLLIASLVVLSMFLVSCATEDLPPAPGKPGTTAGGAFAGKAVAAVAGYAPPEGSTLSLNPDVITLTGEQPSVDITATVIGEQYVWGTGYHSKGQEDWRGFSYAGSQVGSSNWLRGDAKAIITASLEQFQAGPDNYVVAYACTQREGAWDCHGNKWMLWQFTINTEDEMAFEGCMTATDCPTDGQYECTEDHQCVLVDVGCQSEVDCPGNHDCVNGECIALPEGPAELGG